MRKSSIKIRKTKKRNEIMIQQKNIVLSIGLLVSNRKDTIRKCLDSLTPIREAIPSELIIIDTGCDEEVRAILKEYADVLEKFTWCNDFSKARNEILKYAHGEWFLYLDDDEWFTDVEELIAFFKTGEYKAYGYASYIQRNYLDMQASQYTDSWVSRMTKLTPEVHFESKIHEYMVPMNGNVKGLRSVVDHFGYVFQTEEALWKHYERNRVLLEEMIKEEPQNLRWYIQLAQEYRTVQEWEKLYDLSENCLKMVSSQNDMYTNIFRGSFYAGKILVLKEWGKWKEGLAFCKKALKEKRNVELFQAFASLRMAGFCYWLGEYEEALKYISDYFKWKAFLEENEPMLFLQKSAPFIADSFDIVMEKEVYSILMCIGLRQGDTSYLKQYFSKLEWDGHHLYVFEDMVQALIFGMNCHALINLKHDEYLNEKTETRVQKNDSLQEQIGTKNSVKEEGVKNKDYQIYKCVLQTMYNNSALWEYFCQELCKMEEEGQNVHNVMELIRDVLPEAVAREEELENDLEGDFVRIDEEMIIDTEELEGSESTGQIHYGMNKSDNGKESRKQKTSPQTEEMKQLVEQIRGQIQLLVEHGMKEEAKSVIIHVRRLVPNDELLKTLERELEE